LKGLFADFGYVIEKSKFLRIEPKSLARIEALHVTDKLRNIPVACNTLSVQTTIFHPADLAISVCKYYNILKTTDGDLPDIKFA
jgi:hypothetical protein